MLFRDDAYLKTATAQVVRVNERGIELDRTIFYPLGGGHNTVGRTEQIVGDWLKGNRHRYVVATKCAGQMGPDPWDQGTSRKHILGAIEEYAGFDEPRWLD